MRFDFARLLLAAACLPACASGPGPAAPPESTSSTALVTPVAPAATSAETQAAVEPPPGAASSGSPEGGCFAKPVTMGARKSSKLAPKALDPSLADKLAACDRETDIASCRYNVGRAYFDANHFEEAGPIFREIALHGPVNPGIYASQLYLECLNVLGTEAEPPRQVCYDEMARDIGPLQEHLCAKDTQEQCDIMRRIERDIARLRAEKLVQRADREPQSAPALYRQAGDGYMALFNQYCAFRRPDVKHKPEPPRGWTDSDRCDEIAYNAMRAYIAAEQPDMAKAARAALLDPDNRLNKGELAKRAAAIEIK